MAGEVSTAQTSMTWGAAASASSPVPAPMSSTRSLARNRASRRMRSRSAWNPGLSAICSICSTCSSQSLERSHLTRAACRLGRLGIRADPRPLSHPAGASGDRVYS
jgi:hypothetical protein